MAINSRNKGKRGERECAAMLCDVWGVEGCRRGQQFNGLDGEDVVGIMGLHIEVKRTESLNVYKAMDQAVRDSKAGITPIVFHRKNGRNWLMIARADDIERIAQAYVNNTGKTIEPKGNQ